MTAGDNLAVGESYFFAYKLRNDEGDSPMSDITVVSLADYPTAPLPPVKENAQSSLIVVTVNFNKIIAIYKV